MNQPDMARITTSPNMKTEESSQGTDRKRLFIKVTRENLPQVKDKYPFLYLERGRLEIGDSSIKWIDCDCNVIRLPIATINTLLLGPGTSSPMKRSRSWPRRIVRFAG